MGLTLSHLSALDVLRVLRAKGTRIHEMDFARFDAPSPWKGERWSMRNFKPDCWQLEPPSIKRPMDVLTPDREVRVRVRGARTHTLQQRLPPRSVLWIDEHASMVRPELIFLQMANVFSMPALVMLGYELCGHFCRDPWNPLGGEMTLQIEAATSVKDLGEYLAQFTRSKGLGRAKKALSYVSDHALSAPEALLATLYSLPSCDAGYGLGPVALNRRVVVSEAYEQNERVWHEKCRFPDLLLGIGPVGINYDGEDHLDLRGLIDVAQKAAEASEEGRLTASEAVARKKGQIRMKVVDDNRRNRQLAARGYVVLPVTKEDLYDEGGLDTLTLQLLGCAKAFFGIDTSSHERTVTDTALKRDRNDLLRSLLPHADGGGSSYGRL